MSCDILFHAEQEKERLEGQLFWDKRIEKYLYSIVFAWSTVPTYTHNGSELINDTCEIY